MELGKVFWESGKLRQESEGHGRVFQSWILRNPQKNKFEICTIQCCQIIKRDRNFRGCVERGNAAKKKTKTVVTAVAAAAAIGFVLFFTVVLALLVWTFWD